MAEQVKVVCENCNGTGRVVDESQAGEKIATCMTCKGNGWIFADRKPTQLHRAWLQSPRPTEH